MIEQIQERFHQRKAYPRISLSQSGRTQKKHCANLIPEEWATGSNRMGPKQIQLKLIKVLVFDFHIG